MQSIKYENFSGLKEDLISNGELPYFLVESYFNEQKNKLLKSKQNLNCDDLINLSNELRVAMQLSKMSVRHTIEVSDYVPLIAKEIEDMDLKILRQLTPTISRFVDYGNEKISLSTNMHGESYYVSMIEKELYSPRSKITDNLNWLFKYMKYLVNSSTSIQLKKETIKLYDDTIKGEIIQLGEFAYFRDLDKKKYAYFYDSKWKSLEKFHDKIDNAFNVLKEDLNNDNLLEPRKIHSITLPVLQEHLAESLDRNAEREVREAEYSKVFRSNDLLDYQYKIYILEPIQDEYCSNLADEALRVYKHYILYERHLPVSSEKLNYFGASIAAVEKYAEWYFEYADRHGLTPRWRFKEDMWRACMTEL